ncbi:MAG: hypothetical protein CMJ59_06235 [Planctomycetaceae bacterium]|nr:hypothetical protein [Planctomycetaceae bacterium]
MKHLLGSLLVIGLVGCGGGENRELGGENRKTPTMDNTPVTPPTVEAQRAPAASPQALAGAPAFEDQIPRIFTHVYRIGNFYIMGTDQRPRNTDRPDRTGEEVVLQAVRLFSSLLDANGDGAVDQPKLLTTMGQNFAFAIGADQTLRPIEETLDRETGRYVISMKTDIWPFFPDWNGKGFRLSRLDSSLWRPDKMNALWEECFHAYNESWNLHSNQWSFGKKGGLGRAMATDIKTGDYDIQEQNRLEHGDYDWNTAVNEYIHQIWVIQKGGQDEILTEPQQKVLEFMRTSPGFSMDMNKDYSGSLAVKVR